jgi:hypothetical protein
MSRCDVSPEEYLERLNTLGKQNEDDECEERGVESSSALSAANRSLFSSLNITLDRVCCESKVLTSFLSMIGFLSPENISRPIVAAFIQCAYYKIDGPLTTIRQQCGQEKQTCILYISISVVSGTLASISIAYLSLFSTEGRTKYHLIFLTTSLCLILIASSLLEFYRTNCLKSTEEKRILFQSLGMSTSDGNSMNELNFKIVPAVDKEKVANDLDRCWELLKQFSLLIVRGSRTNRIGSIHRLQQTVLRNYAPEAMFESFSNISCVAIGQKVFEIKSKNATCRLLSLETTVWVISTLWKFNVHDSTTCI